MIGAKSFVYSDSPSNRYVEERERVADESEGISIIPIPLIGQSETYTWARSYFDNEGKIRKKESSGSSGKTYTEDFAYDYLGRLTSQSEPYITGQTPKFTILEYDDSEGRLTKITGSDGNDTTYSYNKFTVTKNSTNKPTEVAMSNAIGQVISQKLGNLTTTYSYNANGNVESITEPGGSVITLSYDRAGNILSKTDANSGTIYYNYNLSGNLISVKDARGKTTNYTYDSYGRLRKYSTGKEEVEYSYDDGDAANAKGKVTSVEDGTGKTEFVYDSSGNVKQRIRTFDDFKLKFEYKYDSLGRVVHRIYPDGTIVSYFYDDFNLKEIKMSTKDGKLKNQKILEYQHLTSENKLKKVYGNGVVTEMAIDPIQKRLKSYKTTTAIRKAIEENKEYKYDSFGNITDILNWVNSGKSQKFDYDELNRLVKAKGAYGEKEYTYTSNGNLTQKGDLTLMYENTNHPNAVSKVISPVTSWDYEYDNAGYVTNISGDSYEHDTLGRLTSVKTSYGEEFNYFYNFENRRVKKVNRLKGITTYYFDDGLYEIQINPGKASYYTLYVKNGDEMVCQWTRTDAALERADATSFILPDVMESLSNHDAIHSSTVLKITLTFLSTLLFGLAFFKYATTYSWYSRVLVLSCALLVIITCAKKDEGLPFYALASVSGIGIDTPSVNSEDAGSQNGYTGYSSYPGTPVEGFYFFHTDHLDSVSMITSAKGEMVAGVDIDSGKSVVSYRPYGEIDRTNSGGPDIFRYKSTGQEEDRETGLYYYKARYYDPKIGRFLEPDTEVDMSALFGMNPYMYVDGNPITYNDPTGHGKTKNALRWGLDQFVKLKTNEFITSFLGSPADNPLGGLLLNKYMNKFMHKRKSNSYAKSSLGQLVGWLDPITLGWGTYGFTGAIAAVTGTIISRLQGNPAKIYWVKEGGFVATYNPFVKKGTAVTYGRFALVSDDDPATIRHERAHIEQYSQWGDLKYYGLLGSGPFHGGSGYTFGAEHDADLRAGTFAYDREQNRFGISYNMYKLLIYKISSENKQIQNDGNPENDAQIQKNNDILLYLNSLSNLGYIPY